MDELPMCKAMTFFRAIQARYPGDSAGPTLEDDDAIENESRAMKRTIKSAVAQAKRSGLKLRMPS